MGIGGGNSKRGGGTGTAQQKVEITEYELCESIRFWRELLSDPGFLAIVFNSKNECESEC
jgi:hypothetical protein